MDDKEIMLMTSKLFILSIDQDYKSAGFRIVLNKKVIGKRIWFRDDKISYSVRI